MMRALVAVTVTVAALAATSVAFDEIDARASASERVVLSLGDRMRVDGADIGCRVAHVRGHGSRLYVECRRAGPLRGSYGAYFGDERVLVVRFVDRNTARVVYSARHEGPAKTCG